MLGRPAVVCLAVGAAQAAVGPAAWRAGLGSPEAAAVAAAVVAAVAAVAAAAVAAASWLAGAVAGKSAVKELLGVAEAACLTVAAAAVCLTVAAAALLAAASSSSAAAAVADGKVALILAAEMMAHVAPVSVVFGTLRYDGSLTAAGAAGSILKSWADNPAVSSYPLAELSSGKRVVRDRVTHGDLDLSDVA